MHRVAVRGVQVHGQVSVDLAATARGGEPETAVARRGVQQVLAPTKVASVQHFLQQLVTLQLVRQ
jgi:hypothetical protein